MIRIHPFPAFMPEPSEAATIACEPYDVISTEEARERSAGNAKSFLHVVRSEIDLPSDTDPHSPEVYTTAARNLQTMIDRQWLRPAPCGVYLYRQTFQGREQCGVVATCEAAQYRTNEIKKHEKTRPDKEDDRTDHMLACGAHAEPVFLTFRDTARIAELIETATASTAPMIDFVAADGVGHSVWTVADADAYVQAFAELDALYIADGHHRTAGAERAATARQEANSNHTGNEEYNRILAVMFPASHLRILAYNRVVRDLNGMTAGQLLARLSLVGIVEPTEEPQPASAGSVCFFAGRGWYRLTFPHDSIDRGDPIGSLDVSLLQSRVLEPVLGIVDPRTDTRIAFVGGIRGTGELEKLVRSGAMAVAFSMHPTGIEQLLKVSDAGQIMPPKSTWFEPKLRSGLFVHQFEPERRSFTP